MVLIRLAQGPKQDYFRLIAFSTIPIVVVVNNMQHELPVVFKLGYGDTIDIFEGSFPFESELVLQGDQLAKEGLYYPGVLSQAVDSL
jgi:hypothetical protein